MIVAQTSYEVTDPTADSQIVALQAAGADALCIFASPKFAALTIRKVYSYLLPCKHLSSRSRSSLCTSAPSVPLC
jgi:hypothetical protein